MLASIPLFLALTYSVTALPTQWNDLAARADTTAANLTLPAVCTPDLCLVGNNSLTAGVLVTTSVNGSSQLISLLPGTYSSSSAAFTSSNSSTSSLSSALFKSASDAPSDGFTASGSLSSSGSYSVSLLDGVTAYADALYQGEATYLALPSNFSSPLNATNSSSPSSSSDSLKSLLLTTSTYAVLSLSSSSQRLVVWDSLPDIGEISGGSGSGGFSVVDVQAGGCATACASGGVCTGKGKCACAVGWEGETCNTCSKGYFGRSCEACPAGCTSCDDGLTRTGLCLDAVATNVTLPSTCNCSNGICASDSSSATCTCTAGWTKASNGTQCAACAERYYMSSSGDCLACDPSCASCSSSSGTCLTCQSGLQPLSSDGTKCTTATTALNNGTFITCPSRTFFSSSADGPNVLLGGQCVAVDDATGVCDGSGVGNSTGGYVYDNAKGVCDALPAKCLAGGIDNFSSSSTRAQLTCSKCIPGSYLVDGACVDSCPDGTAVSSDGLSCEDCSSSCATCSTSASYCTSCASSSQLLLNGTCISGPSCPTGYFSSTSSSNTSSTSASTATCLACHPDCATCDSSSSQCASCPSSRPVLTSSGTCVPTCSSTQYFDTSSSSCTSCSSSCATCSGSGAGACLSCPSGSRLKSGKCVAASDCAAWVGGFGVCLSDLVVVEAESAASDASVRWKMPWWLILVIVLVVLASIGGGVWWFRKREQKRRREHTKRFAYELGNKEVDKKLAALPVTVAYPPVPRAPHSPSSPSHSAHLTSPRIRTFARPATHDNDAATHDVPLTPRFVLEDPASPVSPAPSRSSYAPSLAAPPPRRPFGQGAGSTSRWSSSGSSSAPSGLAAPLVPQSTGASGLSTSSYGSAAAGGAAYPGSGSGGQRTFTTQAGNTLLLNSGNSRNPFLNRM
ncbi:hypothetical protein JCM10207_001803 [Rhodosporidiobolus poonsookiae]